MKKSSRKNLVAPVKESAQSIWLAGLGALATAGEEGGKLFEQLVKRGEAVDKQNRSRVQKLIGKAGDLRDDAGAMFGTKVKKPLDRAAAAAMHKLGVPTRSEILELTKRVEALTRAVEKQAKKKASRSRAPKTAAAAV